MRSACLARRENTVSVVCSLCEVALWRDKLQVDREALVRRPSAKLGELERAVMQVLWDASYDVTARQIADALDDRALAKTTILTVLSRLERKGRVQRCRDGWAHTYRAVASREDYIAELMHDALGDASDRSAALARFVDQVTPADAELLRQVLEAAQHREPTP